MFESYLENLKKEPKDILALLKYINVLVIDNNQESTDSIRNILLDKVNKLIIVNNIDLAFYKLSMFPEINLVILDINISKYALHFAKEIKERYNDKFLIVSSEFNSLDIVNSLFDIGVDNFLQKPIKNKKLLTILQKLGINISKHQELEAKNLLLKQYKDAVDTTSLVSKTDKKGLITYANEQFVKLSGYTLDELIGEPHNIVRHPDMPKEAFEEMWQTIKAKKIWKGIVKNRKKDGSFYIVDATIIPILDTKGDVLEYVAIRYDITELENYKEILKEELLQSKQGFEEKAHFLREYEKAINESSAVLRTDIYGEIKYVNDAYCKISKFSKNELIGNTHKLIRDPNLPSKFFKELWDTITKKQIWSGVIRNIDKDKMEFHMATTIIPILNLKGDIVEYMSIGQDVSDLINLHLELEVTQKEIICTLGSVVETRSKETGNHIKRVAEYSAILGEYYGLNREEVELLKLASPMHDVGKVGIADAILNKPGRFTDDEFEIMQTHTNLGFEMLKSSQRDVLKLASLIAYEHHEKYNGRGYPRGIKGEEISIFGRITALADVFDALGSDRVYKKAWELEKILDLIRSERGEHFDPKLVDIFFEHLDKFLKIRDEYRDV